MIGALRFVSSGALATEIHTPPATREDLLPLLDVPLVAAHMPLRRHRAGLTVQAFDAQRRPVEADLYVVARTEADGAGTVRILDLVVPAPALVVAQKEGGPDFSKWVGYAEGTDFLRMKSDVRALLERAQACEQASGDPDFLLDHMEGNLRDLGKIAPDAGVLRLVALDSHENVAMAGNFYPSDWRGMRGFCLRAFDAHMTAYAEGAVRAPVPVGSTAESPPVFEFIKWREKPAEDAVKVRVGDKIIYYGSLLPEPAAIVDQALARVPVAGLPVFGANGERSKPVTWSRA